MITIREEPAFVTITAAGRLTREDYDCCVPSFERIAKRRGKVPMMLDATALEGWDIEALWRELKFDATHQDSFGPIAVIGDKKWEEWAVAFSKPFFKPKLRFFHPDEIQDARRWLAKPE